MFSCLFISRVGIHIKNWNWWVIWNLCFNILRKKKKNILRKYQTTFQSSYIILPSHQQSMKAQLLQILANTWYYLSFYSISPSGYKVVSCNSDVPSPNDQQCWAFSMCLLVLCLLWRNVYLNSLLILKLVYLSFYLLSCKSSLYILDTSSLSDTWLANMFSHSVGCFHFLDGILWSTEMFNFHVVQNC